MNKMILLVFISLLFSSNNGISQDYDLLKSKNKIGVSIGHGGQYIVPVSYDYNATIFQVHYFRRIFGNDKWSVDLNLMPNFVTTYFYKNLQDSIRHNSYEFGLNGGVILRRAVAGQTSLYMALTAGPHYIEETPDRQRPGFIFSDNLSLGMLIGLNKQIYLDLRASLRHVSNAQLMLPNKGMNNVLFYIGAIIPLEGKKR